MIVKSQDMPGYQASTWEVLSYVWCTMPALNLRGFNSLSTVRVSLLCLKTSLGTVAEPKKSCLGAVRVSLKSCLGAWDVSSHTLV